MPQVEKRGVRLEFRAVGDKQLKQIAKNMKKVSDNSRSVRRNFSGLRNVFLGVFASRGVASVVRMADSVQLLGDRINAFIGDTEKGAEALDLLFAAANRTNSSVDTLADGFNRIALATQELGLSTEDMIAFTTTLQNAFRIQGASAAESRGAIIQLTQGLASGALRGQELRSVLEASAVAGSVIADAVGIARGELIKFAETGALTSEVVLKAFSRRALELDTRAAKLGTTFGQTLTKAANEFKKGINELNRDLELNKSFEKGILGLTEAIKQMFITVSNNKEFQNFARDFTGFFKQSATIVKEAFEDTTPITKNRDAIRDAGREVTFLTRKLQELEKAQTGTSLSDQFAKLTTFDLEGQIKRYSAELTVANKKFFNLVEQGEKLKKTQDDLNKGTGGKSDPVLDLIKNFSKSKFDQVLKSGALNLQKLNLIFGEGADKVKEYNLAVLELKKQDLQKQFSQGKIDAAELREELEKLNVELSKLNGTFNPLQQGAKNALKSIGTFSDEVVGAVENSFSTLEDQLFDFTKTGKFLFNDFAQAVLDDISRIIIRTQLIKPLLDGLSSGFGGGNVSSGNPADSSFVGPLQKKAKGGIIERFAKGGVVNEPTFFPTRSGTGLMGETGRAEAVLPLKRVSGGDLGVKALPSNTVVNINNQAGAEIEIEESADGNTKTLDITITKAVKNAINQGRFDKALSSSFGLNRKGSR